MSLVWFDGSLEADEIPMSPRDRGLTLGDGVFETILVKDKQAVWCKEHLLRMQSAATTLAIPFPEDNVDEAISVLLDQADNESYVLRMTLTRGVTPRGLSSSSDHPVLFATLDAFDETLMFKPVTLITSSVRRNQTSPASKMKTLSYIDSVLAAREAHAVGAEDALMLNTDGEVACTTVANIFVQQGETLITPPLSAGVLPGIARAKLMQRFPVVERRALPDDLERCDAMFVTNSLRLLRPVTALDGKTIGQASLKNYEVALLDAVNAQ